jgi:hypothetical protein
MARRIFAGLIDQECVAMDRSRRFAPSRSVKSLDQPGEESQAALRRLRCAGKGAIACDGDRRLRRSGRKVMPGLCEHLIPPLEVSGVRT